MGKAKFFIRFCLCALFVCISAACSTNKINTPKDSDQPDKGEHAAGMPLSLEIIDEVNDGERLHVLGAVSAKVKWDLRTALVKLTGVSEGQVVGVSYLPLIKAHSEASGTIEAGQKFNFSLSVPAEGLSDYQLELLWGDEAVQYIASVTPQPVQPILQLKEIEIETLQKPCQESECPLTYRLKGKLVNSGAKPIQKVVLGVGFIRAVTGQQLDLARQIPQNEERVEVDGVNLASSASRPVVLNFDSPVFSESLPGELKPMVRILSYE